MADFRGPDGKQDAGSHAARDGARPIFVDPQLLADFGHQLRTHLNAVLGAAGLLASGAESNEERELAGIVRSIRCSASR